MENVLKKIISKKKERIEIFKKKQSQSQIFENIKNINNFIDFKDKINFFSCVVDRKVTLQMANFSDWRDLINGLFLYNHRLIHFLNYLIDECI